MCIPIILQVLNYFEKLFILIIDLTINRNAIHI